MTEEIHSDDGEAEELLVDDFDGQCSRTYPDNHSRIVKWRASKNEQRKVLVKGSSSSDFNVPCSELPALSTSKETTSDIRCKDWAKTENSRVLLSKSSLSSSDTNKANHQSSIISDQECEFAAKKRRLMTSSSSLDHSKSTSAHTTESSSTGISSWANKFYYPYCITLSISLPFLHLVTFINCILGSTIPVGIAIGRQRQQQEPRHVAIGEKRKVDGQGQGVMPPHLRHQLISHLDL